MYGYSFICIMQRGCIKMHRPFNGLKSILVMNWIYWKCANKWRNSQNCEFLHYISHWTTNETHHSAYPHTPSGSVCSFWSIFPISSKRLSKNRVFKHPFFCVKIKRRNKFLVFSRIEISLVSLYFIKIFCCEIKFFFCKLYHRDDFFFIVFNGECF